MAKQNLIVSSKEMARCERQSFEDGEDPKAYMLQAGLGIAKILQSYDSSKKIILLVGKGNNGGDAFVVGHDLVKKGFNVKAFCLFDAKESSDLNRLHRASFEKSGQICIQISEASELQLEEEALLLDGLLGTGFEGDLKGLLLEVIQAVNQHKGKVVAIDIPSGLNGSTGKVSPTCVQANLTITLGAYKQGFFLEDGYKAVGELKLVDFGMPQKYFDQMATFGKVFDSKEAAELLPKFKRTIHKYEKGYLLALAGSKGMCGAAKLCTLAALRAGSGIVRLFISKDMEQDLESSFPELIKTVFDPETLEPIIKESQRAKAFALGSGLGHSDECNQVLEKIYQKITLPLVIDAEALDVYFKQKQIQSKEVVLTPHQGEFLRCLKLDNLSSLERYEKAKVVVKNHKAILVLKGAPTFVFSNSDAPVVFPFGSPALATAGSGDVLTGIIGALLSNGLNAFEAAKLGVYLHAKCGEEASKAKSDHSVIASDLIENIPKVISKLRECSFETS